MKAPVNQASEKQRREWAMQKLLTDPILITDAAANLAEVQAAERSRAAVHARVTRQIAAHRDPKPPARRWTKAVTVLLAGLVAIGGGIVIVAFLLGPTW